MSAVTQKNSAALLAEVYFPRIAYEYSKSENWPIYSQQTIDGSQQYFTLKGSSLRFQEVPKTSLAPSWDEAKGLWCPKVLPIEIWQEAVADFAVNKYLITNIHDRVVPVIFKHLSESEIEDIICDYFCSHSILGKPIRYASEYTPSLECASDENFTPGRQIYYFDYERMLRVANRTQKLKCYSTFKPAFSTSASSILLKKWEHSTHFFRVGMSLKDCIHIFLRYQIGKRYNVEKKLTAHNPSGRNQHSEVAPDIMARPPEERKRGTAASLAKEYNVSHFAVHTYKEIASAIDQIAEKDSRLSEKYLSGQLRIKKDDLVTIADMTKWQIRALTNNLIR